LQVLILNSLVHSDKPVIEIGRDEMKNAANKPPHEKEPTLLPGKYTSKIKYDQSRAIFAELQSLGPYQAHRFELWQSIRSFLEAFDDEC